MKTTGNTFTKHWNFIKISNRTEKSLVGSALCPFVKHIITPLFIVQTYVCAKSTLTFISMHTKIMRDIVLL